MQNILKHILLTLLLCSPVWAASPAWDVDASQYEFDMSLTGKLELNREPITSSGNLVGAFVNGECRGIAETVEFTATGDMTFSMPIYSNVSSGEVVTFKAYLVNEDLVYSISDSMDFIADQISGDHYNPVVLALLMPPPDWSVNPADFEYDLSFTGVVTIDGIESIDENDLVGAFVNGELRGFSALEYYTAFDRWFASFPIYSNTASGEVVSFQIYDASAGILSPANESLTFTANDVVGDFTNPTVLSLGEITAGDPWTILIYLDGDNDLEDAAIDDINEMESVVLPDGINVIVQIDRIDEYNTSNGDWTDTRRYEITYDTNVSTINSLLIDGTLGELNMGDPQTLADFITWGVETYPAENYMLIMWNHGGGWRKKSLMEMPANRTELTDPNTGIVKAICWDETNGGDNLEMRELKHALGNMHTTTGKTFNIMGFDACLMGLLEVAYGIKDYVTDAVVFSQETEPGDGWDYASWLSSLSAAPESDSRTVAGYIVDSYGAFYADGYNTTQSALDMTMLDNLKIKIDNFANSFTGEWSVVDAATDAAFKFNTAENYADLKQFMQYCAANLTDGSAATDVVNAIDQTIIHNAATGNLIGATGLNIYLRRYLDTEGKFYYSVPYCNFAAESDWTNFLLSYKDYMRSTSIVGFPKDTVGFEDNITLSWKTIDADGDSAGFFRAQSSSAHTGDYVLALKTWYNQMNDWLITPKILIQDIAEISFWARSTNDSWLESFNVKVSTTGSEVADFTTTLETVTDLPNSWTQFSYDLSAYSGQEIYVAIQGVSFDKNYLFIDDISLINSATINADFSASPLSGTAPLTVQFSDLSAGNPTSWNWDFGDGYSVTVQSPQHTYESAGTYTVTLEVSDGTNSDIETKTDYIIASVSGEAITSTTAGGNWSESTTWIGGVVPTSSDNVIIDGNVIVNQNVTCNNLTINLKDTLQNTPTSSPIYDKILQVNGSIINNGIICNNSQGNNSLEIEIAGDITNNGHWKNSQTECIGSADQIIMMDISAIFTEGKLLDSDSSSAIIAGSDLTFSNNFEIDLEDDDYRTGNLVLPVGSGFTLNLIDTSHVSNAQIQLNSNKLYMSNAASLLYNTRLMNAVLSGAVTVDNTVFFSGDVTVLQDTLQNIPTDYPGYDKILQLDGHFINNGVVRNNPRGNNSLEIELTGNLTNNNTISNSVIRLNGNSDQTITFDQKNSILSAVDFYAMIGTGDYQWYYENSTITGATSNILPFDSLSFNDYGSYYCSTNDGYSRTINVSGQTVGDSEWDIVAELATPIREIHFLNSNTGYAVGGGSVYSSSGGGVVFKTEDGGNSWTELTLPDDPPFSSVYFTDENNGWVVGGKTSECRIFHTNDGGITWTEQNTATNSRPTHVFFISTDKGWISNDAGNIQYTADGGTTWSLQSNPSSEHMMDILFVDENTGWAGAQYATILHTTDGGSTWESQNSTIPRPSSDNRGFGFMDFINENTGWVCGDNGWIVNTSDGGLNWALQETPADGIHLRGVDFIDLSNGFAVGSMGTVLKTSDGGATWEKSVFSNSNWLSDICYLNDSTAFISDGEGNIYKYLQGSSLNLIADFSASVNSGPAPLTVQFSDLSSGTPISWEWDFDNDGAVDATEQNPSYTYTDAGTFTVAMTVSDGIASHTEIKADYIVVTGAQDSLASNWSFCHPTPTSNDIRDAQFVNSTTGYACGDMGIILKTSDGGESWQKLSTITREHLRGIHFVDELTGFACGDQYTIIKTTDGGDTWQDVSYQDGLLYNLYDIYTLDQNTAIAAGYSGIILKTTDSGVSWQMIYVPNDAKNSDLNDITFLDNNSTGFVVGNSGTILKTTDAGESWNLITSPVRKNFYKCYFIDNSTGWIVGFYNTALKTTDGGESWTSYSGDSYNAYKDVYFTDSNTGYILKENGIIKTNDGGQNWETIVSDYDYYFSNFLILNPNNVFIYAWGGHFIKSTDNWETYSSINSQTPEIIEGVEFIDNETGFTVDRGGNILKTSDGGDVWELVFEATYGLYDITHYTSNKILAVGSNGSIVTSENYGDSWSEFSLNDDDVRYETFYSVEAINSDIFYAVGSDGAMIKSTDGGHSWNILNSNYTEALNDIQFINQSTGFAVGGKYGESKIIKTTDSGDSWTDVTSPVEEELEALYFINSSSGFAVGSDAAVIKTTDGGNNWEAVTIPVEGYSNNFQDIQFFDEENGIIVGSSGLVYWTEDGGESWTQDETFIGNSWLNDSYFFNKNYGFVVGMYGSILKYQDGMVELHNSDQITEVPKNFQLYQNYPNPFNPTTTIRYGLPETGKVRIAIFNLYGQKVVDLVNKTQNTGYYQIIWNGKNQSGVSVSSGVYICYINVIGQTQSFSSNMKMLLMK